MEDTFRRAMRIRTLSQDAVMERKTYRAENNSSMPAGDVLSACFIKLTYCSSRVEFAIAIALDPLSN